MASIDLMAQDEFARALKKAKLQTLMSRIQLERAELLSFYDIKELVKPKKQTFRGTKPIKVSDIMGSEGRYRDFTKAFLPRKQMLRGRWTSINKAHHQMVDLPAISVYKLGNAYFVRDGNHRVSVARTLGVEFIDAEIVELDSEVELEPGMTNRQIREKVIAYERKRVLKKTDLDSIIDMDTIRFTAPGRYTEMLHHINVHKYYINQNKEEEYSWDDAVLSWYRNVYLPIVEIVNEQRLVTRFPGRTESDLYMWIVKHWDALKEKKGQDVQVEEASRDFAEKNKISPGTWIKAWVKRVFGRDV